MFSYYNAENFINLFIVRLIFSIFNILVQHTL